MPIQKKKATPVIDSRHLKILAAKRDILRDSVVLVCLDEEKYGLYDKAALRKLTTHIDQIEPSGVYFPIVKKMDIAFYDKEEFRNRDLLVTIRHENPDEVDYDEIEAEFKRAIPNARSVDFVHLDVDIEQK